MRVGQGMEKGDEARKGPVRSMGYMLITCSIWGFVCESLLSPKSINRVVSPTYTMLTATCFSSRHFLPLSPYPTELSFASKSNIQNNFIIDNFNNQMIIDNFNNQMIMTVFSWCSPSLLHINSKVFF